MKTITKEVEVPKLEISFDEGAENPRNWWCVGYLVLHGEGHIDDRSIEGLDRPDMAHSLDYLAEQVAEQGDNAESLAEHLKLLHEATNHEYHIIAVTKYQHGAVSYSTNTASGFDYSTNGFYFVLKDEYPTIAQARKHVDNEIDSFNSWANGCVYRFMLFSDSGEVVDSCGGYYSLEDIKESLGDEWQDEDLEEYIIYN